MKTKSAKKFPTIPVVTIVAILLVVSTTLAMFFSQVQVNLLLSVSNFHAYAEVWFDSTSGSGFKDDRGYLVDLKNTSATNYIGNLKVNVSYAGNGVGLIRVRVVEEWSTAPDQNTGVRQILPYAIKMPYLFGANNANLSSGSGNQKKWFDNRENDYRLYYATPVYCTASNAAAKIPLITGFDTTKVDLAAIDASTQLHIQIEADVVQVNRYPQFWGMDVLPWASAIRTTEEDVSEFVQP